MRALANLGISYANQSMGEPAAACFLKALELNPKDSASLHILGIWHFSVANLGFLSRSFVKVKETRGLDAARLKRDARA